MKPLDPRLLREARAARWFITGVVALATLGVIATIVIAWQLTRFITGVFVEHERPESLFGSLLLVLLAGLVKAVSLWLQDLFATRAAAASRAELRAKFLLALTKLGAAGRTAEDSTASRHNLATRGLDALDAYFAKYLPQLVLTAIATPILGWFIFVTDWSAGLILVLTLPLIPLFMTMIGWATRSVQQRQFDALNRLSQHFLEVLRGLATLKVFDRHWQQVKIMEQVGEQYRKRTMKVLGVSFLSGFALELGASLSVALMAVSIGFRLIDGAIPLSAGLFVLLIAPEAYLPIRAVGANFHAAAEGVLASGAVLDVLDSANRIEVAEARAAEFKPTAGQITVVVGISGAGKTSALNQLRNSLPAEATAWLPQANQIFSGSVLENIVGPGVQVLSSIDQSRLERALQIAALDDLEIDQQVGESGLALSGGQRQRIGLARAVYKHLGPSQPMLLLDEPVSAVDSRRTSQILAGLKELASGGATIVAVSHQDSLIDIADTKIEVAN